MIEIHSEKEFETIISQNEISVVMFSTDWCPDCLYIKPFVPQIEKDFSDLKFYLVNRDTLMDVAIQYDVLGIPSFVCFSSGTEISRFVSTLRKTKDEIETFLKNTIESEGLEC